MEVDVQPWSSLEDVFDVVRVPTEQYRENQKRVEKESCSVLLVDQTKKSENEQSLVKSDFDKVDRS